MNIDKFPEIDQRRQSPDLSMLEIIRSKFKDRLIKVGGAGILAMTLTLNTSCAAEEIKPEITYSTPSGPSASPTIETTPTIERTPTPSAQPSEDVLQKIETQTYPDSRFESTASWSDDFSTEKNGPINSDKWNTVTGPPIANGEIQYYTNDPSNVRIENGLLTLQAQKQSIDGLNYTSGRIDTLGKQDFEYGKLEITAKLPAGVGTWPAIWLAPTKSVYSTSNIPAGANPYYANGELDIAETSGVEAHVIYCIAHSAVKPTNNTYPNKYYSTLKLPDSDKTFHTYGVSWTPDEITFTIDNQVCYKTKKGPTDDFTKWPYNQPYHLIINQAVGGTYFTGDKKKYPPDGIDLSALPSQMQIKDVKYFKLINS